MARFSGAVIILQRRFDVTAPICRYSIKVLSGILSVLPRVVNAALENLMYVSRPRLSTNLTNRIFVYIRLLSFRLRVVSVGLLFSFLGNIFTIILIAYSPRRLRKP